MRKFLLCLAIGFISATSAYANNNSPIGYWKTIDDVSGKVKSVIHITENASHEASGQLVKIYPRPGETEDELCTECKGDKHNKPILGMVILTGMKQSDAQWEGGRILDPTSGKSYRMTMKVTDNGQKLEVHGYIGLPLFGRTQIWERTDTHLVDHRFK